jgi:hypothetical protein
MLVFPVESEVEASSVSPKDQQRTRVYSFPSDVGIKTYKRKTRSGFVHLKIKKMSLTN